MVLLRRTGGWIGALVFVLLSAGWAEGAKHRQTYLLCRNKKTVRTIRVEVNSGENQGCETLYTKAGVDRSVGSGVNHSSCLRVMNNIKGNLEAASWTCKDITAKSDITESNPTEAD